MARKSSRSYLDIPNDDASEATLIDFARQFNGYDHWGAESIPRLNSLEEIFVQRGALPDELLDVPDLRAALFMSWRAFDRGGGPGAPLPPIFFAILRRMRERVTCIPLEPS